MLKPPVRSTVTVVRDPVQSRAKILKAARTEFAKNGLSGARVDQIAATAGINKRMLYHYFGNKDDLFCAVLEDNYAHKRESEKALALENEDPVAAVEKLIALTWDYYIQHPEFLNLLNSANLHKAKHLRQSKQIKKMHTPFLGMIESILDNGVAEKVFRSDMDPAQLYITIAGLSSFYLSNQYTLSVIFGRDLMTPKSRAQRLKHMTDVVLSFLKAP
ncbi:MAG: TetR/AcrR family transcriptional regulator [Limnohabitans sp.]|nr:TetR/AcrR family transcriptional regulator [Limnohabitans sp.]